MVGGEDDGPALLREVAHHGPEAPPALHVHGDGRLVQEDELGIAHDGQGEPHPLGLAPGQALGRAIGEVGEPGPRQGAGHRRRAAVEPRGHGHQLAHLHAVGEPAAAADLEHGPHPARSHGRAGVGAEDRDVTLLGPLEPEEDRDGGGLPGSVGAEKGHGLAPGHLEVEMVEGQDRPVAVDHAGEAQRRPAQAETRTCRAAAGIHDLNVIGAPAPSIECLVASETATLGA